MPSYTTIPIPAFQSGLYTEREPRLAATDAFPTLLDARVERGVLEKRLGYKELADTGNGYPVMGITTSMQDGHPVHLACDTRRAYLLDTYAETLTDLPRSDIFDGTNKDYFWFETWANILYMTNSRQLYYYDASSSTFASLDTGDVEISGAKMIFIYKNRMIFICPLIDGTWHYTRLYYTNVNTTTVSSSNYVTGQFADTPITGCKIGEQPYIFCREGTVLRIRYTQNADAPFTFEIVTSDYPVVGPFPVPTFRDNAFVLCSDRAMRFDQYALSPIDQPIRYITSQFSLAQSWWMTATRRRDKGIIYMTYPNDGSSATDRILQWNYDEGTFAIYRIPACCIHATTGNINPSGDDLASVLGSEALIDTIREKDTIYHPDYGPMLLAGGLTGKIFLLENGNDDDGSDITMQIKSGAWNPFAAQNRKVKFGKMRILVDTDATASFTVNFYKDLSGTAYKTSTCACDGTGDQHWITLFPDGEVGNFHRVEFTNTASDNRPRIHAMNVDMAPAGKLDAGGAESEIQVDATSTGNTLWRWIQNSDGNLELQKKVSGTWTKNAEWGM